MDIQNCVTEAMLSSGITEKELEIIPDGWISIFKNVAKLAALRAYREAYTKCSSYSEKHEIIGLINKLSENTKPTNNE